LTVSSARIDRLALGDDGTEDRRLLVEGRPSQPFAQCDRLNTDGEAENPR
jgi:hypothetical protein